MFSHPISLWSFIICRLDVILQTRLGHQKQYPSSILYILPHAHQAKGGVKQLVHVCPSVHKRQFMIKLLLLNIIFWTRIGTWIGIQTCRCTVRCLNSFGSHMSGVVGYSVYSVFTLSTCRAVKQNLKSFQTGNLLPLRMLLIKDTNDRHEELM